MGWNNTSGAYEPASLDPGIRFTQKELYIIYPIDIRASDDADKPNGMTPSPKSPLKSMKTELQDI